MKDLTAWWAPIVVGVLVYAAHNATFQPWTLDDAYITFRYADNLAAGLGPVYNEGEHVEGYTTFLWMVMLAAASAAGLSAVWVAKLYGLLASMGTLVLVSLSHRVVPGLSPRVAWYAGLLVATNPVLTRWSMSGMEVPLVGLLITAGLLVHLRDRACEDGASTALAAAASALCVLAAMTRPDAGLLFGVLGLDRLWQLIRRRPGALGALAVYAAVFAALYGGYFAWRYDYYGWLLPNTFYVKVGATSTQVLRGLYYLSTFLVVGACYGAALAAALLPVRLPRLPLIIVSVLFAAANIAYIQLIADAPLLIGFTYFGLALAVLAPLRFRIDNGLMVGAALAGLHTLYVVLVGGDVMYGYRFFTAILPTMALLGAAILHSVEVPPRWRQALFWAPLVLNGWWMAASLQLNAPGRVSERGIAVGLFLREHAPSDALVAVNVAGTIPYYSGLRAIDTLGLNDEHIAHMEIEDMGAGWAGHEKGDGDYVLSRAPDYVIFASAHGAKKPRFRGDHDLFDSEVFQELYDLYVYDLETEQGEAFEFTVWQRRPENGGAGLPGAEPSKVIKGDLRASLPPRDQRFDPTATWW